jgi:hypothetical protein
VKVVKTGGSRLQKSEDNLDDVLPARLEIGRCSEVASEDRR